MKTRVQPDTETPYILNTWTGAQHTCGPKKGEGIFQDRQRTYDLTMGRVHVTIVAVQKNKY